MERAGLWLPGSAVLTLRLHRPPNEDCIRRKIEQYIYIYNSFIFIININIISVATKLLFYIIIYFTFLNSDYYKYLKHFRETAYDLSIPSYLSF